MDGRLSKPGIVELSQVPFEPFIKELRKRGPDITMEVEHWDGGIRVEDDSIMILNDPDDNIYEDNQPDDVDYERELP